MALERPTWAGARPWARIRRRVGGDLHAAAGRSFYPRHWHLTGHPWRGPQVMRVGPPLSGTDQLVASRYGLIQSEDCSNT